jgi:hypothetical protein
MPLHFLGVAFAEFGAVAEAAALFRMEAMASAWRISSRISPLSGSPDSWIGD